MDSQVSEALTLLGIGMVTVFIVLSLVVLTGKCLVLLSNFFSDRSDSAGEEVSSEIIAVISAAVDTATLAKGKITKIEKK